MRYTEAVRKVLKARLRHTEAVQKVFKSTTSASPPPFEGSPRAGAAEYVLRGDVNNQLVTKTFCSLISLF